MNPINFGTNNLIMLPEHAANWHGFTLLHALIGLAVTYVTHVNWDKVELVRNKIGAGLDAINVRALAAYQWLGSQGGIKGVLGKITGLWSS